MHATKSATHEQEVTRRHPRAFGSALEPAGFFFTPGRAGEARAAFRSRPLGAVEL